MTYQTAKGGRFISIHALREEGDLCKRGACPLS